MCCYTGHPSIGNSYRLSMTKGGLLGLIGQLWRWGELTSHGLHTSAGCGWYHLFGQMPLWSSWCGLKRAGLWLFGCRRRRAYPLLLLRSLDLFSLARRDLVRSNTPCHGAIYWLWYFQYLNLFAGTDLSWCDWCSVFSRSQFWWKFTEIPAISHFSLGLIIFCINWLFLVEFIFCLQNCTKLNCLNKMAIPILPPPKP